MTEQYQGPPHYWYRHSLVPREKYYYGYYAYYGPDTDLSMYKPIGENSVASANTVENFSSNSPLLSSIGCIILVWVLLRLLGVL